MAEITVELNHDHGTTKHLIPKGTKFQVDEHIFNQCKQFNRYIEVTYNNLIRKISPAKLDKVTTPLDFATQEEYVILECIDGHEDIELHSLHKVRKVEWEKDDKQYLLLSENVKRKGHYRKTRFKIHQPNQILNPVTGKPRNPKTIEVEVISDSIAKTDDGRTHYKIVKDSIIEVNKEEWDNRALQKVTIKTDRPEYELKEWKYNLRFISTMKNLLEPIKPNECFKDEYITIEALDETTYLTKGEKLKVLKNYWTNKAKTIEVNPIKLTRSKGIYLLKNKFKVVSDEMKAKESIYNKAKIKTLARLFTQPNETIEQGTILEIDLKEWDNDNPFITFNWKGVKSTFGKDRFRLVQAIHEEAGTFPTIPQGIKPNEYGKMVMFGTGGGEYNSFKTFWDNEEARLNNVTKIDWAKASESLQSLEPKLPKDWSDAVKDGYSPQEYYNMVMNNPSRNESSLRTKPWQDHVAEMSQYYNIPILKELDGEALEKRIAELKHGKQLVWDEVGISPERLGRNRTEKAMQYAKAYGMSIDKQFELANKTGLLWQTYPDKMRDDEIMKGLIQDNLLADIADSTYTIYTPSRRSGLTWSKKLLDVFMEAYKQSKSSFTNITRTKRPKKKKQHIVESMSNIKL